MNSILPQGYTLGYKHLHPGNSKKRERHNKPYVTVAWIKDADKQVVAKGKAMCSRQDTPNKEVGGSLAIGRALKNFERFRKGEVNEM